MKNALRELREVDRRIRCATPATTNIGAYVASRANVLAPLLRVDAERLEDFAHHDDEELAPRLQQLVKDAVLRERQGVHVHRRERAYKAASELGATARQTEAGFVLDVEVLLGELLVDTTRKYISLQGDGVHVVIERHLLARAAWLRRLHLDVAARVHTCGLQLRWRGGKGGLDLRSVTVPRIEAESVIQVTLMPRHQPSEQWRGVWLGDIVRELGFVT